MYAYAYAYADAFRGNNESCQLLERAGVYEELYGDEAQQKIRKIGQVVTMTSLDWVRARSPACHRP